MRVTTELKHLIKRNFDEKRALVQREAEEIATVQYNDLIKKVESSKEFKQLVKVANSFRDTFAEYKTENSYSGSASWCSTSLFKNMDNIQPTDLFCNGVKTYVRYNKEMMSDVRAKVKKLDLAQESLMIKLIYEKDLDKIREMLGEYGINI